MSEIESNYKTLRGEQVKIYNSIVKLNEDYSKADFKDRKKYVLDYRTKLDLQVQQFKANDTLLQAKQRQSIGR